MHRTPKIVALRPGGGLGLYQRLILDAKGQLARKKKSSESRVCGVFQRDDTPVIGAVQTPSDGVARGAGPVQLPVGASSRSNSDSANVQYVDFSVICFWVAETIRSETYVHAAAFC